MRDQPEGSRPVAKRSGLHRTVAVDLGATPEPEARKWPWPWYLVAVLAPIAVLLAGWVVLSALTIVGWLSSPEVELSTALRLAADLLVLAHGAPVTLGGQTVSIAPLGLTALLVFLAMPLAGWAARQAAGQQGTSDDTGQIWADTDEIVMKVGGTFATVYAMTLILVAVALDTISWRVLIGGVVVGAIAGLWGASRGVDHSPMAAWPAWLRSVPRALGAATLTVLAGASFALAIATWLGREPIAAIVEGLDGGVPALVLLIAIHLLYLPNLVLAVASWMLGAGITLGDESLVTMAVVDAGLQPAIPAFGLVPTATSTLSFWWLIVGVIAGIVAALVVAWSRPRARFDETALVGGLSGVAAGLLIVVACALGSGSLGSTRLAHIGARIPELAIFAPTLLGLSGMAAGLVLGLLRRPARPEPAEDDGPLAEDKPVEGDQTPEADGPADLDEPADPAEPGDDPKDEPTHKVQL